MNGFILVDKPKGITSFSVCNKIRKNLNLDKTGHNGTLDPNATGLMVIGCNKALKEEMKSGNNSRKTASKRLKNDFSVAFVVDCSSCLASSL